MKILVVLALPFIFACSTVSQKKDPSVVYSKDMKIEVNGEKFTGYGVAKRALAYSIKIRTPADSDYLLIQTCNRENKLEDEGKKYSFEYVPVDDIETRSSCPMEIISLNDHEKHSFGFIAFESRQYKLSAFLKCNGQQGPVNGVSACQSKIGLIQRIQFPEPVEYAATDECDAGSLIDSRVFEYAIKKGQCMYIFRGKDSSNDHMHYTLGYEETIVRKN